MNRNYKSLALLLFILLVAAACGTSDSSEPSNAAPVEPTAALLNGAECPEALVGTTLFTNAEDGFCLLLPDGYAVDDSLTTETGGLETAVYVDSMLDTAHPRLFITVEAANGRSLDEISAEIAAAVEASTGATPVWSTGLTLAGQPTSQFDQLPGPDVSRQMVLVPNGRLYTLAFTPDDPAADAYAEMQTLYNTVVHSFTLLP